MFTFVVAYRSGVNTCIPVVPQNAANLRRCVDYDGADTNNHNSYADDGDDGGDDDDDCDEDGDDADNDDDDDDDGGGGHWRW